MVDLIERCGEELSVGDAFYAWLMEHACDIINRFKVQGNGKTAWEQLKSRPFTGEVYLLGAQVLHRTGSSPRGGHAIKMA